MTNEQKQLLENCLRPSGYTVVDQKTTTSLVSIIQELHKQLDGYTEKETLRDKIAMAALAGMLAWSCEGGVDGFATVSYQYADAMLKARKGGE